MAFKKASNGSSGKYIKKSLVKLNKKLREFLLSSVLTYNLKFDSDVFCHAQ